MTSLAGTALRLCLFAVITHGGLLACTQTATPPSTERSDRDLPAAETTFAVLDVAPEPPPDARQLNVGVAVFEHETEDATASADRVPLNAATFARIRSMEAHYLPVVLRNTLTASNHWGAVSVLPAADPSVDLLVRGRILESTGARLKLEVRAVDSSGREWLAHTYIGRAHGSHYPHPRSRPGLPPRASLRDPFEAVHVQIANDLLAVQRSRSDAQLRELRRIAHLNHALDLSPDAFAGMLTTDADGYLRVARLPASSDPLLRSVLAMRTRHHVFMDTIDAYYDALYYDTKPLYDLWRQYSLEYIEEVSAPRGTNAHAGAAGTSFETLRRNYERYRSTRLFEEEFVGLASGFADETAPAVLALNQRVHGLTGSVEEQYAQWRELLRALFEVDRGSTADPP